MKKLGLKDVKMSYNVLIYGETGVGKTVSTLLTVPKPCAYVMLEQRGLPQELDFKGVDVFVPENFIDLYNFLSIPSNFEDYQSIVVDSLSYLANVQLMVELEEETRKSGTFNTQKRPLTYSVKTDLSGYGALASWMVRIVDLLLRLSKTGKLVVSIATLAENPKWDTDLWAVPAFAGREFNKVFTMFFDLIGLVIRRKEGGKTVYPPFVFFDQAEYKEREGDFMAKWTGKPQAKKAYLLDFSEILKEV